MFVGELQGQPERREVRLDVWNSTLSITPHRLAKVTPDGSMKDMASLSRSEAQGFTLRVLSL